jgi:uncharacterized protein
MVASAVVVGRITVVVSPGAARSEIVGPHGDAWKVRVAAPPAGGRANAALVALLADALTVPARRVVVVAGRGARKKIVDVAGIETNDLARRLASFVR